MTDRASTLASALAEGVAREFRTHVVDEYVPRIGRCVELLSEEQIWHRPGPHGNSVGNLLLHLAGNTRQWILAGIDGQPDDRDRPGEFAADRNAATPPSGELMERLQATVEEAAAVVDNLTADDLLSVRTFQSRWDQTCLAAVLHVLEHFSGHAGQIYAYTKQTLGLDLKFWDV